MATLYRKKPVVVEAVKWDGSDASTLEVHDFIYGPRGKLHCDMSSQRSEEYCATCREKGFTIGALKDAPDNRTIHVASIGDFIIKGVKGEFYPCKPDIFETTYAKVRQVLPVKNLFWEDISTGGTLHCRVSYQTDKERASMKKYCTIEVDGARYDLHHAHDCIWFNPSKPLPKEVTL
jgi:hypothetical protein